MRKPIIVVGVALVVVVALGAAYYLGTQMVRETAEKESVDKEQPASSPPPAPREPTTEDVVRAFEAEGLEVGEYYDVEDYPEWGTGMLPKTMDSGTRFELSSYTVGQDPSIGDVFHFATSEDQRIVSDYLETVSEAGGMFYTHVYETDGFLLKIDGNVPKNVADRYGGVLEE